MAKKPSGGGGNSKVEAANARKAGAKAQKDAKAQAAAEAAEASEWSSGAKSNAKREEAERKKAEADAKKAELKKLQALEEHEFAKVEDKNAIRKAKAQKAVNKPWEEALAPVVKKSNKGSRAPAASLTAGSGKLTQAQMAAQREEEAAKAKKPAGKKDIQFESSYGAFENRNREIGVQDEARSLDAALDLLSMGEDDLQKHPERRAKAVSLRFVIACAGCKRILMDCYL